MSRLAERVRRLFGTHRPDSPPYHQPSQSEIRFRLGIPEVLQPTPPTPARHYITFSDRGVVNGLSAWPNDGFDFGPDTPGTKDNGRTEATELASRLNLAAVGPLSSVDPTTWHLLKYSPPKDPKV